METPLFPNHRTIMDAMKVQLELEGIGDFLPNADEAAELWKEINQENASGVIPTILLARELSRLGFNRNHATQLILHVIPKAKKLTKTAMMKPPKDAEEGREGQSEEISLGAEISALLPSLERGKNYSISDIFAMLSNESEVFAIGTERGRQTAIGKALRNLTKKGKLQKVKAQYATYRLASDSKK